MIYFVWRIINEQNTTGFLLFFFFLLLLFFLFPFPFSSFSLSLSFSSSSSSSLSSLSLAFLFVVEIFSNNWAIEQINECTNLTSPVVAVVVVVVVVLLLLLDTYQSAFFVDPVATFYVVLLRYPGREARCNRSLSLASELRDRDLALIHETVK